MNDRPSGSGTELLTGKLSAVDVDAYLDDPLRKQSFVTPMFDTIAPRYDDFTRLFSFGMDVRWKRIAIAAAIERASRSGIAQHALDLACGTGDLAIAIARGLPGVQVTAIDASPRMIEGARSRVSTLNSDLASRVHASVGDMTALDVADASIDIVTAGYGVRNVPDYSRAIAEMARVMRPGATLVTLDFYRPENALWRSLLLRYLAVAGNAVGWWWHRDPVVYGYIAKSIERFVSWQEFTRLLVVHGFRVERVDRFLGGGIAVHVGVRAG